MPDQSHLDQWYFVDGEVYNCPFCKRRHVKYSIIEETQFDWDHNKPCYVFIVECHSCEMVSMHLTFREITVSKGSFNVPEDDNDGDSFLDSAIFYSVPRSFFVLDERIPKVLRELLTEAEGCLKSNFLTGASACVRKIVYELCTEKNAEGDSYRNQIKSLKSKCPEVEPAYFETLIAIHELTCNMVHENSYDGWEGQHLKIILNSLSEVLYELYVLPADREDRRRAVQDLKKNLTG